MKLKIQITFQIILDIVFFICAFLIVGELKPGGNFIAAILLGFCFPFLSNDKKTTKIAFTIAHGFIAYLAWSYLITGLLSNYLYKNFIHNEHSLWDILDVLIPVLLTILVIIYDIKRRVYYKKSELIYLLCLALIILIRYNI